MSERRSRAPRKITAQSLDNAALHYLERFASSSGNLRRVLRRKVARAAAVHETDPAEGHALIETLIARYLAAGLLDDRAYAAQKAASLRRRGSSRRGIAARLAEKAVERTLIEEVLDPEGAAETGDLAAACTLVRRRRLGPYRRATQRDAMRQRDLATLGRAGFSFEVARRVLSAPDPETLEAWLREAEDTA